ncbi:MAG: hypothetical protein GEU89_18055 [Kiloniellaceae bacterium]|nr:hypothetical protein [Kiloniellaceae bacterium]
MSSFSRNEVRPGQALPIAALIFTWALVHLSLILFRDIAVFDADLVGPDSFMRMLRINELYQGQGWFDGTIARANAPYGDILHWTRPFDLLVMLLALPISLVTGYEQALYVAGMVISPLLQLATALALIWTLRPVIRPAVWFLPAVALFLQPGALSYSVLGRADHHSLLLLVFVIAAGFILRALRNPMNARPALLAGVVTGIGIWLSVEFLLVLGLCLAALGSPWLFGERERAAQNKWFALGLSVVLLVALLTERPFDRLLEPSYDQVSGVHFLVAVCCLLFWRMAETYEERGGRASRLLGRTTLLVVGVGAAGLLVAATFPQFFAGPMAEVDPRIRPLWLDRVVEMRPITPSDRDSFGKFALFFGVGILSVPLFLKILVEERSTRQFWLLFFVALASLLLWIVSTRHIRFSGYSEIAFIMAFAVVLDHFLGWTGRIASDFTRGLLRGTFLTVMLLGPVIVGCALMSASKAKDSAGQSLEGCDVGEVARYLNSDARWSREPQTILTFIDIGPELLYRTPHAVLATPYHRNGDGIYDSHRILTSRDEPLARELMAARRVDLVLLCRSPAERAFFADPDGTETLYLRLDQGRPPAWLEPVDLPPGLSETARLYHLAQ